MSDAIVPDKQPTRAERIVKFYQQLVDGGLPDYMAAELASREYQHGASGHLHVNVQSADPDSAAAAFAKRLNQAINRREDDR